MTQEQSQLLGKLRDCGVCLCRHCQMRRAAADEIERLQAIVDRLPRFADGTPAIRGDHVYWDHGGWGEVGDHRTEDLIHGYPTPRAAEQARAGK